MKRARLACAMLLGVAAVPGATLAAEPGVDGDLLEFLGSVDSVDKHWHDYLARTDIDKVAQHAAHPPPVAPGAPAPKDPPGGTRPAPVAAGAPVDQT